MLILISNIQVAPYISVEFVEEAFLLKSVHDIMFGSAPMVIRSKLDAEEVIEELQAYDRADLGEGHWIEQRHDMKGLASCLIDQIKEITEDRDYEDKERVKYLQQAEAITKRYNELCDSLQAVMNPDRVQRIIQGLK